MINTEILEELGLEQKEINNMAPVVTITLIGDADDGDSVTRTTKFYINDESDRTTLKKVTAALRNKGMKGIESYIRAKIDENNGYSSEVADDAESKFLCDTLGFSSIPGFMCFDLCDIKIIFKDENGATVDLQVIDY